MHGLYLLWWVQAKHVSPAIVAAILAAGDLTIAALEIPAGWIADRYGHRVSLLAGSLIQSMGMLACWLGAGVAGLLGASLLVALGDVFRSGADQALLYRSCVALDREADFQRIEARSRSLQTIALVALTLLGGAIVSRVGFAAGWLTEVGLSLLGLLVAWTMCEPPACPAPDPSQLASAPHTRHLSLGTILSLLVVIAPVSVLDALAGAATFILQVSAEPSPERLTLLVAAITLAEAAGAVIAAWLPSTPRLPRAFVAVAAAVAASAWLAPAAVPLIAIALAFLQGAAAPIRAALIQRMANDAMRAQAASLASAVDKGLMTAVLLATGWMRRR